MCTNCEDLADLQWSKIEEPLSVNKAFIIGNHGPLHIGQAEVYSLICQVCFFTQSDYGGLFKT